MKEFDVYLKVQMKHGALQEFILEKGWTQSDFAREMGISVQTAGRWFNMRDFPRTVELMGRLCSFLGKTPEEIFPQLLRDERFRQGKRFLWIKRKVPADLIPYDDMKALPAPEDMGSQIEMKEVVEKILERLNPKERKILRLRFGLEGEKGVMSCAEVGETFGVTGGNISAIEGRIFGKLRHPSRLKYLREFEEVIRGRKKTAMERT